MESTAGGTPWYISPGPDEALKYQQGPTVKLFSRTHFIALFIAVVVPLLINGVSEAWFGQRDERELLDGRLRIEAGAAADKDRGLPSRAVQFPWSESNGERQRQDALHVLHQVPAITELMLLDGQGIEGCTSRASGPISLTAAPIVPMSRVS